MNVLKRWMWLLVLVLGLISLVFGVIFVMGGSTAKSEMVDGFYRTQVKVLQDDGTYKIVQVKSAKDIEDLADYMKSEKYRMEDERAQVMVNPATGTTYLPAGGSYNSTHRLDDAVKYDLYLAFLKGPVTFPGTPVLFNGTTPEIVNVNAGSAVITPTGAPTVNPYISYLPTIDAQLVFGVGKLGLGMAKLMTYMGFALIVIGVALILVAVMILGFTKGFEKVGAGFTELMKGLTKG